MRCKIIGEHFLVSLYILSAVMLIGMFFGISVITSVAFALSFFNVLFLWILYLKECNTLDILAGTIIAVSFVSSVATCTVCNVSYFNNWLMFSSVFLYFSVCLKIKPKYATVKKLAHINSLAIVACLLAYIIRYDSAFYITNTGVRYLKFDFYNPNCLALFLLCIACLEILFYSLFDSGKKKMLKQIFCVVGFSILIAQTLSRTAMLTFFLFLGVYFLIKRKGKHYLPKSYLFNIVVAIFPLMFTYIYMFLVDNVLVNNIFSFLVSEGKGLDSRQIVWKYAFDLFEKSPLFGSYGDVVTSSLFSQMHNSHLNVLVSYGVVVFLLMVVYLFIVLSKICIKSKSPGGELSVWAFIICLVLGAGEAILFSGGLSFYLLVGQFLILSNVSKKDECYRLAGGNCAK